jgi:hypothetical protein
MGVVDILTADGEMIKAAYEVEVIPWTFYITSKLENTRKAYRFNGLEGVKRLTAHLEEPIKWMEMSLQFEVPEMVSIFGLYKWYAIKDVVKFYNTHGRQQIEDKLNELEIPVPVVRH